MTTARMAVAAAGLVALLAACGGGGGGGGSSQPATAEGLEAFVREAAPQLLTGDEGTYDLLSAACRSAVTEAEWNAQLALATGFLEAFGVEADAVSIGTVETRDVTATEGEASV
jgi:hypothetical protein